MTSYFNPEQLESLTTELTMSSISRYASWLKKLQPDGLDIKDLSDKKDKYITQALALKDDTQTMVVLLKMLKIFKAKNIVIQTYEKAYNKIKYKPKDNENRPANEKEKSMVITYEDLLSKRDELNAQWEQLPRIKEKNVKNLTLSLKKLIIILYTELPPLRGQDYFNTSFDSKTDSNYITFGDISTLTITDGKTMKNKEPRIIELNDIVVNAITQMRVFSRNSKWLIPQVKDTTKHMTSQGFSNFLNRIFDKSISSTTLRNIVVSHMIDKGSTKDELDKMASTMGHTPATQRSIYSKHSKRLHPSNGDLPEVKELKERNKQLEDKVAELEKKLKQFLDKQ